MELTTLVQLMNEAFNRRDWAKWSSYLDEHVVVETVLSPDRPVVGRDAVLRAATAAANQWYDIALTGVESWDDAYVYACGSARTPSGSHGFKQQTVHWLMRYEHGRLVRSHRGSSRDDLERLYQRLLGESR